MTEDPSYEPIIGKTPSADTAASLAKASVEASNDPSVTSESGTPSPAENFWKRPEPTLATK